MGPELQHVFGVLTIAGGESVKVTGPDGTPVRALPAASVARLLFTLLLRVPGASGAFQRTETPVRYSPASVFTLISTAARYLRVPEMMDIGTKFALSVAPFIFVA